MTLHNSSQQRKVSLNGGAVRPCCEQRQTWLFLSQAICCPHAGLQHDRQTWKGWLCIHDMMLEATHSILSFKACICNRQQMYLLGPRIGTALASQQWGPMKNSMRLNC